MKRSTSKIVLAVALLVTSSCVTDIDVVKSVTMTCQTQGYVEGTESTTAFWNDGEQFYMFRSEDWAGALMTLTSNAGEKSAQFSGNTAGSREAYYGVRPAAAAGTIMPNGEITIEVEPNNIFFAHENASAMIPQIGVGGGGGLTFTSLFGALRFEIEGISSVSYAKAAIPNHEQGLYGVFEFNFKREEIFGDDVKYKVARRETIPMDISADNAIYLALPADEYEKVELIVRNDQTGRLMLYTAENIAVKRGNMLTVREATPTVLPQVVGSWRLKSYCNTPAEVDLYMEFRHDGTFTILQRSGNVDYKEFNGTYEIDSSNSTISGRYDDGEQWGENYKFSLDGYDLVLESLSANSEISVYESVDMPEIELTQMLLNSIGDIKPL